MRVVVEVVAAAAALCLVLLLLVAARRVLLQRRGGAVDLSLRLRHSRAGAGWALGIGRFEGDALRWYRVFSLAPRPRRVLSRTDLSIVRQREPERSEAFALLADAVVLDCTSGHGPVTLAMEPSAVTGFLAWLEARPPGATLPT